MYSVQCSNSAQFKALAAIPCGPWKVFQCSVYSLSSIIDSGWGGGEMPVCVCVCVSVCDVHVRA